MNRVMGFALTTFLLLVGVHAHGQRGAGRPPERNGQAYPPAPKPAPAMDMTQFDKCAAPNSKCWPDAFPRPGATKLFENDRIIVWDQTFADPAYEYTHKHTRAFFIIRVAQGAVRITSPDGKIVVRDQGESVPRMGSYYEAGHGPHSETAATVNGERARSFYIELKGTEEKEKLVNGRYPKTEGQGRGGGQQPGTGQESGPANQQAGLQLSTTPMDKCAASDSKCWPDIFPRPGATKVFENNRIVVWDQIFPDPGQDHMHKHTRDFFIIRVGQGVRKISTPDGHFTLTDAGESVPGMGSFLPAGTGPHSETAATKYGQHPRSFYIELKGTEPKTGLVDGRWPK